MMTRQDPRWSVPRSLTGACLLALFCALPIGCFDRSRPTARGADPLRESLAPLRERADATGAATVVRILPTAATWPENVARVHVEFSAPMAPVSGLDHVRLLDDRGRVLRGVFEAPAAPWNEGRTRYTLLVSGARGLRAGGTYTLAVDQAWPDATGRPLAMAYRQLFAVGPPDHEPVILRAWHLTPPRAGRYDPLVIAFPEPLTYDSLHTAIGVVTREGVPIRGAIRVDPGERQWNYHPNSPWVRGRYEIVILSTVEDLAGHKIDPSSSPLADAMSEPRSHYRLPFDVK
jgi:hypothetical protein